MVTEYTLLFTFCIATQDTVSAGSDKGVSALSTVLAECVPSLLSLPAGLQVRSCSLSFSCHLPRWEAARVQDSSAQALGMAAPSGTVPWKPCKGFDGVSQRINASVISAFSRITCQSFLRLLVEAKYSPLLPFPRTFYPWLDKRWHCRVTNLAHFHSVW